MIINISKNKKNLKKTKIEQIRFRFFAIDK